MAAIRTTCAGSAQIVAVMNAACANSIPLSRAKPANPTKALIRMKAGKETILRMPRANQSSVGPSFGKASADFCMKPR
jgi:hypothetical protein